MYVQEEKKRKKNIINNNFESLWIPLPLKAVLRICSCVKIKIVIRY